MTDINKTFDRINRNLNIQLWVYVAMILLLILAVILEST